MENEKLLIPEKFKKFVKTDFAEYDLAKIAVSFEANSSGNGNSLEDYLNWLFFEAKKHAVSDIHFQDRENGCQIRYRHENMKVANGELLPRKYGNEIDKLLRAYGKLSDTDKRRGQTTAIYLLHKKTKELLNIRINFTPTQFGQNIVCRLGGEADDIKLENIDLPEYLKKPYLDAISAESGFIAVSGPTGSGKTRTLVTSINHLNDGSKIIHTVEDPPEISIPGANQVAVTPQMGFKEALRNFLRQDPDIILVGELRDGDSQSTETALHAANTGHLVFTTFHAPDTPRMILRLIQLGCEPYSLGNSLTCFFSQRLMRRLCTHCALIVATDDHSVLPTRQPLSIYYRHNPNGCSHCNGTGLNGRIPVFSMGFVDQSVRMGILAGDLQKITQSLMKQPTYRTLAEAALERSSEGFVDFDEAVAISTNSEGIDDQFGAIDE